MSILSGILGNSISTNISKASYTILDNIYSYNAIWLQDATMLFSVPFSSNLLKNSPISNIPLPLIGFAYELTGEIDLLAYQWSKYPYLSKEIITNAGIKQATSFSVNVHSVLSPTNPVVLNVLKIQSTLAALESYVSNGGLFTIMTMYGTISDCVLDKVSGISGQGPDGTQLKFMFTKPNISQITTITQSTTQVMTKLISGAAGLVK